MKDKLGEGEWEGEWKALTMHKNRMRMENSLEKLLSAAAICAQVCLNILGWRWLVRWVMSDPSLPGMVLPSHQY